jgi:hypothetical protein
MQRQHYCVDMMPTFAYWMLIEVSNSLSLFSQRTYPLPT